MKFTNKSIILDEKIYKSLLEKQQNTAKPIPPTTKLANFEKHMESILSNKTENDDQKFIRYQQLFSNYKNYLEDAKEPVKVVVESVLGPVQEVSLQPSPPPPSQPVVKKKELFHR